MSDHHAAISTLEDMIRRLELDVERRTQDVEKLRDECARFDAAIARDRGAMDQHRATIAHLKGAVTVDVLKRIDDQTNGAGFNTTHGENWAGEKKPISDQVRGFLKTVTEGAPTSRPIKD